MIARTKPALCTLIAAAAVTLGTQAAHAGPIYSFSRITANAAKDVAPQLTVEVNPAGANTVDFTFRNAGPLASSITGIYFDDGTLLGISQIFAGPGVSFTTGGPSNLPGGNAIGFETTAGFSARAAAPVQPSGVNPGEWVTIRFNLINGQTFADTIDALDLGLSHGGVKGSLRIGLHVQGLANGQSDSFVNGAPIPLPSAGALGLAGLACIAGGRRRRGS